MSRRRSAGGAAISLDSFLDIVTNVVGVLILIAVVTVLSASDFAVASGATALSAPRQSASRIVFECSGDRLYFVDEERNAERVRRLVRREYPDEPISGDVVAALLALHDVGDANHRVQAEIHPQGMVWTYALRRGALGEPIDSLGQIATTFQRKLSELGPGGFVYFVVHDDSFEAFRQARDLARARGIATGWHPVEGQAPLRLSGRGSLGKRIQ